MLAPQASSEVRLQDRWGADETIRYAFRDDMSQNAFSEWGLEGEWIPRLPQGVEISKLPSLDPKTCFLLSRVDGNTSVSALCQLSGLGERDTLARLAQLFDQGILTHEVPRRPKTRVAPGAPGIPHGIPHAPPTPAPVAAPPPATGPAAKPSRELSPEQKIAIQGQYKKLETTNHYEVLGLQPEATRREIKQAYYHLSKTFHPDVYFGVDIGSFKDKLEAIYRRITEANDLLTDDDARRRYDLELAEKARAAETSRKTGEIKNPLIFGQGGAMFAPLEKARGHFTTGRSALEAGNWAEALNSFQLAKTFNPGLPDIDSLIGKAKAEVARTRGPKWFAKAEGLWELAQKHEALECYRQAADADPDNAEYQYACAMKLRQMDEEADEVIAYARRALHRRPSHDEALELMAETLFSEGRWEEAARQFERLLNRNKKHPFAARRLKEARKKIK